MGVGHDRDVTMHDADAVDWNPRAPEVQADQIRGYDAMRARCPVAHGAQGNWTVFGHADTLRILEDHDTFSNVVSAHVAIPNGMDPPEHTALRAVVNRYFNAERVHAFEPTAQVIVDELVVGLDLPRDLEVMSELAEPFANAVACAFMGWPETLREPLREWTRKNHRATLAMDREAMSHVALEFDRYIREQLEVRRRAGAAAPEDATTSLLREVVDGQPLTDEQIVSIVRNWTVGELGTIASSIGIIADFLAAHPEVLDLLRNDLSLVERATDEILRIHAPLISNRRRTTRPVSIGGREISADERVIVLWASANRDERIFGDPDEFRLDRDPDDNLLYGRGIHDCPGAPLARLELRLLVQALVGAVDRIAIVPGGRRERAHYPSSGFSTLDLHLTAKG
jgi:cytochrome P450